MCRTVNPQAPGDKFVRSVRTMISLRRTHASYRDGWNWEVYGELARRGAQQISAVLQIVFAGATWLNRVNRGTP